MKLDNFITDSLMKTKSVVNASIDCIEFKESLRLASELIIETYTNNGKVILAGNGGSASDCQHICAEFIGRFKFDRPSLPAIALTGNSSNLTCLANDYGYENVFSRQIEAHASSNDTLIVYTTSGESPNILKVVESAKPRLKSIIAMTGKNFELLNQYCDVIISVDSLETSKIQEVHAIAGHMICESVEHILFDKN